MPPSNALVHTSPLQAPVDGGGAAERHVTALLEAGLDRSYEIFPNIEWQTVFDRADTYGELDIVVMGPNGALVILEVKSGSMEEATDGLFKQYGSVRKDVSRQLKRQYGSLRAALQSAGLETSISTCLVLTDHKLRNSNQISIGYARVIDAAQLDQLPTIVARLGAVAGANRDDLRQFLLNRFDLVVDVAGLKERSRALTRKLAAGLATWVPRITSPSGAFHIDATAGGGKTQLALRLLRECADNQGHPLYVCYNRPLADHMTRLLPARCRVASFHELCVDAWRQARGDPDFGREEIFNEICDDWISTAANRRARHDLLIIDEAQDLAPEWIESLLPLLVDDGRLYVLEDRNQLMYRREAFALPGAVLVHSMENFRTPRNICHFINLLKLTDEPIVGASPISGNLPVFEEFEDAPDQEHRIEAFVKKCLGQGYSLTDIAVLSFHGVQCKAPANASFGQFSTRRFLGTYDSNGNPDWSKGDLLFESIYRFKGQSAPIVILSDLDFSDLDERTCRKLFVGLTRAEDAVCLMLTPAAAHVLEDRLK